MKVDYTKLTANTTNSIVHHTNMSILSYRLIALFYILGNFIVSSHVAVSINNWFQDTLDTYCYKHVKYIHENMYRIPFPVCCRGGLVVAAWRPLSGSAAANCAPEGHLGSSVGTWAADWGVVGCCCPGVAKTERRRKGKIWASVVLEYVSSKQIHWHSAWGTSHYLCLHKCTVAGTFVTSKYAVTVIEYIVPTLFGSFTTPTSVQKENNGLLVLQYSGPYSFMGVIAEITCFIMKGMIAISCNANLHLCWWCH